MDGKAVDKKERDPLTERIIGCCFAVHTELGPGFKERIYQNVLELALGSEGLEFQTEKTFKVFYMDKVVGIFRADLIIENRVILEMKSVGGYMPKVFESQILSYLRASEIRVGLLVNFGNASCEVKRFVL